MAIIEKLYALSDAAPSCFSSNLQLSSATRGSFKNILMYLIFAVVAATMH